MRYFSFKLISSEERERREKAEWHERMAKAASSVGRQASSPPPPLASPFYHRPSSLDVVPTTADVRQFPVRKREEPRRPPPDLPPAVPLRPAALQRTDLTPSQLDRLQLLGEALPADLFLRVVKLIDRHEDPEAVLTQFDDVVRLQRALASAVTKWLRPAGSGKGQALLRRLKSYDLARDPGLREMVEALDRGDVTAEELLTRAEMIDFGRSVHEADDIRKALAPLPASTRLPTWRR